MLRCLGLPLSTLSRKRRIGHRELDDRPHAAIVRWIRVLDLSKLVDSDSRQMVGQLTATVQDLLDALTRPVLRQNSVRRQVLDLSALIRRRSRLNGHSPAPPASTPPDALRRPPSGRPGEPCSTPPTRRL